MTRTFVPMINKEGCPNPECQRPHLRLEETREIEDGVEWDRYECVNCYSTVEVTSRVDASIMTVANFPLDT